MLPSCCPLQIPAPRGLPQNDPPAVTQAICRRLAAGLEAGGCRSMQIMCGGPTRVAWELPAGGQGGRKKKAQLGGMELGLPGAAELMQRGGMLQTVQVQGGLMPTDASVSLLMAVRLEGGRRVLAFQQPLTAAQLEQLTAPGSPAVVSLQFADHGGIGDPRSAALLSHPAFVAASAASLAEAHNVVLQPGLSLGPYTQLGRLYALVPGPLSPAALPPHLEDVKLTCLPSFPPSQRRFNAQAALAGRGRLAGLRLQGWSDMDLLHLRHTVKCLTVLLPELPPGSVLGSRGGPLLLPPGHVFDLIGIRMKPVGGLPAAEEVEFPGGMMGMGINLPASWEDGMPGYATVDLTELARHARVLVVEGHNVEANCSCGMMELAAQLTASPLQELQLDCSCVTMSFASKGKTGGADSSGDRKSVV